MLKKKFFTAHGAEVCINNDYIIFMSSLLPVSTNEPKPEKLYSNIHTKVVISQIRSDLYKKSGIYAFINTVNRNRYIGSGVNLYRRFLDHLKGRSSNLRLQKAFKRHGINKFDFVVYAFAKYSVPLITDMETLFMSYFPKDKLYNFKYDAASMYGYKHTDESIAKMKKRFLDPQNHPMFEKTHSQESKNLISKPGVLNPMYGRKHSESTKTLISNKLSSPVSLYDNNNTYILTFNNNVQLSEFLGCAKSTIGLYVKTGKLFKKKYYFKKENNTSKISNHPGSIPISLYDKYNKFIQDFNSQRELSVFLKCDKTTVASYLKSGKLFRNLYYLKKKE